jgi:hypothetical protein
MTYSASSPVSQTTLEARIIRADGSVEELGTIAYWHKNPLRRFAWRLKQLMRGRKAGRISNR